MAVLVVAITAILAFLSMVDGIHLVVVAVVVIVIVGGGGGGGVVGVVARAILARGRPSYPEEGNPPLYLPCWVSYDINI